jgi:hypothetical protein
MNQDKSDKHAHFSEISERLAHHLGINLDELPSRISISKDMFYAYRTGRHRISEKAWRKLETAEISAGLKPVGSIPSPVAPMALSQELRAQAARLLAMAEQVERDANKTDWGTAKNGMVLTMREGASQREKMEEYKEKRARELAEAKAELDDIIRTVDAADDLPEVKPPVVRRRA